MVLLAILGVKMHRSGREVESCQGSEVDLGPPFQGSVEPSPKKETLIMAEQTCCTKDWVAVFFKVFPEISCGLHYHIIVIKYIIKNDNTLHHLPHHPTAAVPTNSF